MNEAIPLSQKLYLLAIHPEKGGVISSSYTAMNYVIIGSLLLELYQNKNIKFNQKRIVVLDTKTEIDIHRFLLDKMNASKRPRRISTWIQKLSFSIKYIRKDVQLALVQKRIIRMQPKQFLFFKWERPVLVNKQIVSKLVSAIEKQVFGLTATEDDILLLSFLKPAGLLKRIFQERDKIKKAKLNLKKMMVENQASNAVADAIGAAQAVAVSVATLSAARGAS